MNLLDVSGAARNYSFPQEVVDKVLQTLAPVVAALESRDLLKYAYVYGFDEMPAQYNGSLYQMFGAIKEKFPTLRTVAMVARF